MSTSVAKMSSLNCRLKSEIVEYKLRITELEQQLADAKAHADDGWATAKMANKTAKRRRDKIQGLVEALEEICEPTQVEYYDGIRCGVEDRGLQNNPYEAAEYGYDQGKDYCQFIAAQALTAYKEEK